MRTHFVVAAVTAIVGGDLSAQGTTVRISVDSQGNQANVGCCRGCSKA